MNALTAIRPAQTRGLYEIGLELAVVRHDIVSAQLCPSDDDGWDALTDRRAVLQHEFARVFRAAHGLSFSDACELLS